MEVLGCIVEIAIMWWFCALKYRIAVSVSPFGPVYTICTFLICCMACCLLGFRFICPVMVIVYRISFGDVSTGSCYHF